MTTTTPAPRRTLQQLSDDILAARATPKARTSTFNSAL